MSRSKLFAFVLLASAVLARPAEAQWQARHALTPAQYQSTFDDLVKQAWRSGPTARPSASPGK